jgi:hypothetical protein
MTDASDESREAPSPEAAWIPFEGGASLGATGTEGGVIVRDDEHPLGARVTLERGGAIGSYAITCGVYGWMVHTCSSSDRAAAEAAFEVIEAELAAILDAIPCADEMESDRYDEVVAMIGAFVDRHP